jgi:exodeoxyribonuclease I
MSFVFYDTETTGVHKSFDQVLQFAAIRTDADLKELDRFEVRCRVNPHAVPSAGALRVTRVSVETLLDPGLPSHYEMMCRIAHKMSDWSPAVFAGWNSMEFDEHLLRQAFYQCLHRPYLTTTNGNCRTDILKLAQIASIRVPGAINIPTNGRGAPVFKLDQIAPLNGFDHVNAHDALADVEATIHMARLLRDRAPDVWSTALRFSKKASVIDFVDDEPAFLVSEFYFNKPYQFAVTKIGVDPDAPGVIYALDLDADLDQLAMMTDQELSAQLHRSPKVIRKIKANACPGIEAIPGQEWHGRDLGELYDAADRIRADHALCDRLVAAFKAGAQVYDEPIFVEELIYSGFPSASDNILMDRFHTVAWGQRLAIVQAFEDGRLRELGRRLVFLHAPETMPEDMVQQEARHLAVRLMGHGHVNPPWLTLPAADQEAEGLLKECADEDRIIISGLRDYLARRLAEAQGILASG